MNVLVAIEHFDLTGGAATYSLVLAQQLQRLGHDVAIVTPDPGGMADHARASGVRVVRPGEPLLAPPQAIAAQDAMIALELAHRLPSVPQVFIAHGAEIDNAMPPQLPGVTAAAVAMNDRVLVRLRGLALPVEVVRLRQPVDRQRFRMRGLPAEGARCVLLLGNQLHGQRRATVERVCRRAGLECVQVGRHSGNEHVSPEGAIAAADIVIGYGRVVLEAMASGRAAYVLDQRAGDGWVTPDRYPALERDGFAGTAFERAVDEQVLGRDLAGYDPRMGLAARKLVLRHHDALRHAAELAELLKRLVPAGTDPDAARHAARLARDKWHSDWRAAEFARELETVQAQLRDAERRAAEAEGRLVAFARTRRYRTAQALGRPLDLVRGRGRR